MIEVPKGDEGEKGPEKISEEIIAWERKVTKIQDAQGVPFSVNPRRNMLRHIIIKLTKFKEKILKTTREKQQITYKKIPIRLVAIFFRESLQARR